MNDPSLLNDGLVLVYTLIFVISKSCLFVPYLFLFRGKRTKKPKTMKREIIQEIKKNTSPWDKYITKNPKQHNQQQSETVFN